jgi:radical SAM-linked protein
VTQQDRSDEHAYLVRFAKTGAARYLSHHDVRRTWERVLRRARLPLAYSHGFSPKPRLIFGPPLQLGAEGQRECMMIALTDCCGPATVGTRLSEAAVAGMPVVDVSSKPRRKFRTLWADYDLTCVEPPNDLASRVDVLLAADRVEVARDRGGDTQLASRDIRPGVLRLALEAPERLDARLRMDPDGIVTPRDLATALGVSFAHVIRRDIELAADA